MSEPHALPSRLIDIHNHVHADDDGSKLVALMDASHVEMTLVMGGPPEFNFTNEAVVAACKAHPGRLVGGAYYDPREGEKAIAALVRYNDQGLRVVKLFPNLGYYPDDASVRPFFEKVAELKMGVLSHCGWLMPMPGKEYASYYAHPGRFEKLVRIFPETIFIMAHMGGIAGFLETVMLTTRTPNTYVDCSPGQGLWALQAGGKIAGSVPPGKLMWGADSYELAYYLGEHTKALEDLGYGPHFEKIFYANARGILEKLGLVKA